LNFDQTNAAPCESEVVVDRNMLELKKRVRILSRSTADPDPSKTVEESPDNETNSGGASSAVTPS
jgi:hypothetical protein